MKTEKHDSPQWSPPRLVQTRHGARLVENCTPTPAQLAAIRANPGAFGQGVTLGEFRGKPQLARWSKPAPGTNAAPLAHRKADSERLKSSQATTTDFMPPCPPDRAFFPFQRAAIEYAMQADGCLLGLDMGTGKTAISCGVANQMDAKSVLVVCPASLKINWLRECEMWMTRPNPRISIARGTKIERVRDGDWPLVIVNYDVIWREPFASAVRKMTWDLLVLDEAHLIKSGARSKRGVYIVGGTLVEPTGEIVNGKQKKKRTPVSPILAHRKLALTGTPIPNRPIEVFPILKYLSPGQWSNWKHFTNRYCDAKPGFGGSLDVSGASNLEELRDRMRGTVMYRVEKDDVLKDLPPQTRRIVELESPKAIRLLLDRERQEWKLHEEAVQKLRQARGSAAGTDDHTEFKGAGSALQGGITAHFSEMSRIRAELAELKVPVVAEYVSDLIESGAGKVLVGCHHRSMISGLMDALKAHKPVCLYGGMSAEQKQESVDAFQNGDAGVFVGQLQAAGVGLTLTASSTCVFGEQSWVPADLLQFEARLRRIGQRSCVDVHYLVFEDSLDATMMRSVVSKMDVADTALGKSDPDAPVEAPEPDLYAPVKRTYEARETVCTHSKEKLELAWRMLRAVAGSDVDGASVRNNVGFSKMDTRQGRMLAELSPATWTAWQANKAVHLAHKYRRQVPALAERFLEIQ